MEKVQQRFYWPRSYSETVDHVRSCELCQKSKLFLTNTQPLKSIKVSEPFELVTMDIIGPIMPESTNGNKFIFVMVDHCTKVVDLAAGKTQSAKEGAKIKPAEQCAEREGEELIWEDDISFTIELTKEQKDPSYQPNYYFRKKAEEPSLEREPRPQRSRRIQDL